MTKHFAQSTPAAAIEEQTRFDLPLVGSLPRDLTGTYLRTGAVHCDTQDPYERHAVRGPSMIHAVQLRDGRAEFYKSRLITAPESDDSTARDLYANGTGTCSLLVFGGRLIAFEDFTRPLELTPALEVKGCPAGFDLLSGGVAPHPKFEPSSGCLHTLSCQLEAPYLAYHVLAEDGAVLHSTPIPDAGPALYHDFCITRTRLVVFDLPVTLSMEAALSGSGLPYAWNERYPARIGVMPLGGEGRDMQWLSVDPCFVHHAVNAWDDGDGIVIDLVRHDALFQAADRAVATRPPVLERWHLDLVHDRVLREPLHASPVTLPAFDDRFRGTGNRVIFAIGTDDAARRGSTLWRIDALAGTTDVYEAEADATLGECIFVPQHARAPEAQGWLLGLQHREADTTELLVFNAGALADGPRARVDLGVAVPEGNHGAWYGAAQRHHAS